MKELSIEEKAKRYDEAIEVARKIKNGEPINVPDGTLIPVAIFPELRESEDERIRKALIDYFNDFTLPTFEGLEPNKILAWLEKQGEQNLTDVRTIGYWHVEDVEQKPADKVEPKIKVKYAGCEYNVLEVKDIAGVTYYGIEDEPNHIDYVKADNCKIISGGYGIKEIGLSFPTKPVMFSEQKPAWSEEDENMLDTIIDASEHHCMLDLNDIDWLKSLKYKVQPKQEWSEEDELKRTTLIDVVKKQRGSAIFEGLLPEELTDWLESLKNRVLPQPKSEWGEEDEEKFRDVIRLIEQGAPVQSMRDHYINWLKSLRPQNTWKPSGFHLECISDAIAMYQERGINAIGLKEILEELKKLKEE